MDSELQQESVGISEDCLDTCHILSKLRLIHHQRTHILLIRMVLLFSQSDFPVQSYEFLNVNNTELPESFRACIYDGFGLRMMFWYDEWLLCQGFFASCILL